MRRPAILDSDRDFGAFLDQFLQRRHTDRLGQRLMERGCSIEQRCRRCWRTWGDAYALDWQTGGNLGGATAHHEFLRLCHRNLPFVQPLQAWTAAVPWPGLLKRRRGAEHAEIIERSPDDLETGRYSQAGHSARNARDRALAHHVEWVCENPLHVSRHFLSIDGEVGVVVAMLGLNRRDRRRRADQDIVLIQDRGERFVHIAGSEVTSIEPCRAVAKSTFEQMN